MNWPSRERWESVWKAVGAARPPSDWYDRLTAAYAEPQRHYHNQQHIAECLQEFDQARHLAQQPAMVELALWFHDAVYDPERSDNEEQSAELAKRCVKEIGLGDDIAETLASLVMVTKTHEVSGDSDAELVVDVDLSILGREEPRFDDYERQIRQEYAWVPQTVFAAKRAEILQRFCERKRIFSNEWFSQKYEAQARLNLRNSITKLTGRQDDPVV